MRTRTTFTALRRSLVLLVALAFLGTLAAPRSLAVVNTSSTSNPAIGASRVAARAFPNRSAIQPGDEIIQSWTVVPGGNRQRSFLSYESGSGLTIEDSVSVQNYGNVSLNLRIYATDGVNTADGKFALLPGDQAPTDVGSWITLAQGNVTVPAGQQVTIPYTLTIPPGADPGDHAGGIVASSEVPSKLPDGNTVILSRQTGVRLYLRVQGQLRSNLVPESMNVTYRGQMNPFTGTVRVRFRIVNRGNVRQAGTYRLTVSGAFGTGKHDLEPRDFPELLPGQSVEVAEEVTGVPALFLARASATVTPKAGGDLAASQPITRSARAFAAPVLPLLVFVVLLAVFVVWRVMLHRRDPDLAGEAMADPDEGSDAGDREPVPV